MIIYGPSEKPEPLQLRTDNQLPTYLGKWGLEPEFNIDRKVTPIHLEFWELLYLYTHVNNNIVANFFSSF